MMSQPFYDVAYKTGQTAYWEGAHHDSCPDHWSEDNQSAWRLGFDEAAESENPPDEWHQTDFF